MIERERERWLVRWVRGKGKKKKNIIFLPIAIYFMLENMFCPSGRMVGIHYLKHKKQNIIFLTLTKTFCIQIIKVDRILL